MEQGYRVLVVEQTETPEQLEVRRKEKGSKDKVILYLRDKKRESSLEIFSCVEVKISLCYTGCETGNMCCGHKRNNN